MNFEVWVKVKKKKKKKNGLFWFVGGGGEKAGSALNTQHLPCGV